MTSSIDYRRIDYRGFIFVVHEQYGLLLLHCTRKVRKGPHFQLPGGHIDDFEFEAAGELADWLVAYRVVCSFRLGWSLDRYLRRCIYFRPYFFCVVGMNRFLSFALLNTDCRSAHLYCGQHMPIARTGHIF